VGRGYHPEVRPLLAYFDTNSLGHMYERRAGVTDEVVRTIEEAVGAGELLIPASVITLEELLAAGAGEGRILGDLKKESECFLGLMQGKQQELRDAALVFKKRRGRMPTIQDIWAGTKEVLLGIIANHAGCLDGCVARGLEGLLASRAVHATVGIRVSQAHAQSVEKKNPDIGDARDQQHIAMAAAVGGVLVTHDKALAKTAPNIHGLSMDVLTASELAKRLQGERGTVSDVPGDS